MSSKRLGSILALVLGFVGMPAMAAQNCNAAVAEEAPVSRYIEPGEGKEQCWGANNYGQLGNGTTTESHTPVNVVDIHAAMVLDAGDSHSCVLLYDGSVKCWGFNGNGQLGIGSTTDSLIPVTANTTSGLTVAGLAVGGEHTCARLSDNSLECWGLNHNGQLGTGNNTDASTPVAVQTITTATAVAAGGSHSCAILADSSVWCWGLNASGQVGVGSTTDAWAPLQVLGIDGATNSTSAIAIAAGGAHSCAVLDNGHVDCWGSNTSGQLGQNCSSDHCTTPVDVGGGIGTATAVAAGVGHSCALLSDHTVKCWGLNADGQLGNGTTTNSSAPVAVSGIDGVNTKALAIAVGGSHSCALLSDGNVECWGLNANGQLGDASVTSSSTPIVISKINGNASAIAAGSRLSCARLSTGTGTLLDTGTGLMWKRCSEGQSWDLVKEACVNNAATYTWQSALQRANNVDAGTAGENLGYDDWRLPNRNELMSLVEHQCSGPAINETDFPSTPTEFYWSSSPNAAQAAQAWSINFDDGRVGSAAKTDSSHARLVRGGQ